MVNECVACFVWWVAWLLVSLVTGVCGCKRKTICRPPPGGKSGCGGRK